jgi:hypothetical protein
MRLGLAALTAAATVLLVPVAADSREDGTATTARKKRGTCRAHVHRHTHRNHVHRHTHRKRPCRRRKRVKSPVQPSPEIRPQESPPSLPPTPGLPAEGPAPPVDPGDFPVYLGVTAREFVLQLSRPRVRGGEVIVELVNAGEDPHDLRLRHEDAADPALAIPETLPGRVSSRQFQLKSGRWRLWCDLPGHEALGMRAVLNVD